MDNGLCYLAVLLLDHKVFCLGMIQSLFEGSMYTFVLEWTPALTPDDYHESINEPPDHTRYHTLEVQSEHTEESGHRGAIPHGFIFATFMVTNSSDSCS
jgi:MFS transporter, MFS domain-containing protein family, molybdate-anion transporter